MIVREDLFLDVLNMSVESLTLIQNIIMEHGQSYPEYGENIPKQWIQLQAQIDVMRRKGRRIISYEKLIESNKTLDEPLSPGQLELFVSFQHNTGNLLHFNEPHLKHLLILDPKLIIDATKSIITCPAFALDVWSKEEWGQMVATGRVEEKYIMKVWKKRDKKFLYEHRDYLLLVLKKLDIITCPKIYEEGSDVNVSFYYVPCMLQIKSELDGECEPREGDVTMVFRFRETEILPPAIYNRFAASCLSLWQVDQGRLFDGAIAFGSGPQHILLIRRDPGSITVSIRHQTDSGKIDNNLVRSVRHFLWSDITADHIIVQQSDRRGERNLLPS